MSRPNVNESAGDVSRKEALGATLSQTLPTSAMKVRYLNASIGMGGRVMLYRFSGDIEELKSFAVSEFANHWHHPKVSITVNTESPFDSQQFKSLGEAYYVNLDWMTPQKDAIGTVYISNDGQISHRPIIFVDEKNAIFYFVMTD